MAFPSPTWLSTTTYVIGDKANYAGFDYISLVNGNLNNIPPNTIGIKWNLDTTWSSGTTYTIGNKVTYNGLGYVSLKAANLNNIPSSAFTWWGRLVVKSILSPPLTAGDRIGSFSVIIFTTANKANVPWFSEPGAPSYMNHVGTIFYPMSPSSPQTSPGPSSVWIGRTVFRVPKPGYFFGLGQRANKPPAMHNSGE